MLTADKLTRTLHCTHTHMHTALHAYMQTHTHIHTYIRTYAHMRTSSVHSRADDGIAAQINLGSMGTAVRLGAAARQGGGGHVRQRSVCWMHHGWGPADASHAEHAKVGLFDGRVEGSAEAQAQHVPRIGRVDHAIVPQPEPRTCGGSGGPIQTTKVRARVSYRALE
jgi:hypothetical protein